MRWEIEGTDEFRAWYDALTEGDRARVEAAIDKIGETGPGLGCPLVDTLKGSRHPNMKELRPRGGHIRIFFAFDPRRSCILLIGGDKTNNWKAFYEVMIPRADNLYEAYLEELRSEGVI